jgi:hypothetical protein
VAFSFAAPNGFLDRALPEQTDKALPAQTGNGQLATGHCLSCYAAQNFEIVDPIVD